MDVTVLYAGLGVLAAGAILVIAGPRVDSLAVGVGWVVAGLGVALLVVFAVGVVLGGSQGPEPGNASCVCITVMHDEEPRLPETAAAFDIASRRQPRSAAPGTTATMAGAPVQGPQLTARFTSFAI